MTYETDKTKAVDDFIKKITPTLAANNSIENIKIYLKFEIEKFYIEAFCDGQENVLSEGKK